MYSACTITSPTRRPRPDNKFYRLRKSERSLQRQLLLAKAAASTTEKNLNSLVDKLQLQIRKLVNDTVGLQHGSQLIFVVSSATQMHSMTLLLNKDVWKELQSCQIRNP